MQMNKKQAGKSRVFNNFTIKNCNINILGSKYQYNLTPLYSTPQERYTTRTAS